MTHPGKRRIGLLGGSFDPPHTGHLWMASRARELLDLSAVWLLPAWSPPHKAHLNQTSFEHRLAMTELLAAGHDFIEVNPVERDLGGISYTIDTVHHLKSVVGSDCELHLIIGGDSLADLAGWRQPEELCREVRVCVLVREGHPDETDLPCRVFGGETHPAQSREIRRAIRAGEAGRWLTPEVAAYIATHGLYSPPRRGEQ